MNMIFAVTSGSYSGYKICALFYSREKAEEFMNAVSDYDYNDIEEYVLDPPAVNLLQRGYSIWSIHMYRDGTVDRAELEKANTWSVSEVGRPYIYRQSVTSPTCNMLQMQVWATSQQQAVKIVNEKRVQMIALGEWVE